MKTFQTTLLCVAAALALGQPGVKLRVNQAGMDFIKELIENQTTGFDEFLPQYNYTEEIITNKVYTEIQFSRLRVSYFDIETVDLERSGSNQITINVVQSSLKFEGSYEYNNVLFESSYDNAGNIQFNYNSVTAQMIITIDEDENKTTSVNLTQCLINLDDLYVVDIEGLESARWGLIENHLKELRKSIVKQFCDELARPVVYQLNQLFSFGQGGSFVIIPGLLFNASFYEFPNVSSSMIEVKLDGTFFPASQSNINIPYMRPALPQFPNSQPMVQLAVGVYVLESLMYSIVEADIVDFEVDLSSIPSLGVINISPQFFDALITGFTTFLNGRPLVFRIQIREVPQVTLTEGVISIVNASIHFATYAKNVDNGSLDLAAVFVFKFNASGTLSITNDRLSASLTSFDLQLRIEQNPPAGQVTSLSTINMLLKQASSLILPPINQLLASAVNIEIPPIFGYSLRNTNLNIVNDAVLLSSDIYQQQQVTIKLPEITDILSVLNNNPEDVD